MPLPSDLVWLIKIIDKQIVQLFFSIAVRNNIQTKSRHTWVPLGMAWLTEPTYGKEYPFRSSAKLPIIAIVWKPFTPGIIGYGNLATP